MDISRVPILVLHSQRLRGDAMNTTLSEAALNTSALLSSSALANA